MYKIMEEKPLFINGNYYWSVRQFAKLTEREEATIRYLILTGNKIRRLKVDYFEGKPFIHANELFEFPFVPQGRPLTNKDRIQFFKLIEENGEQKLVKEEKAPVDLEGDSNDNTLSNRGV